MVGLEYLPKLKEFLQQGAEIVPQIRKLLEETAFLIFQLASWAALIVLLFGGFG